ncbi:sigma-54-dependent Fis family transcriptional regulator [bacterium]|nr:sigma-54-dependent Fis family transcriptional regulator [FCB group bacterium]MBL7191626.1 sigma-54-dependent Fis family transcriptional regulator [bacterium]
MKILFVDDDTLVRSATATFIETALGHEVVQCDGGEEALQMFLNDYFPIVITDIKMPGMNGLELLKKIKASAKGDDTGIIMITGFSDMDSALAALREGAFDYLCKPVNPVQLAETIARFCKHQASLSLKVDVEDAASLAEKTDGGKPRYESGLERNVFLTIAGIGKTGVFSDALKNAVALALRFHDNRNVPALIEGETGTGKEVIARLIHCGAENEDDGVKPFVSINISALSPSLWESELFGYEGGAFTGSKRQGAAGKMELAKGGTLFLDEIADIPLEMQPKLLRALQENEIYRVGGPKSIKLDVRFIVATNRNLNRYMEEGRFRKDLYFRLNLGRIYLPPLRAQKEAIIPLAQMFLSIFAHEKKRRFRFISREAMEKLENYPWPGNVRELRNTIERVVILYDELEIVPEHLNFLNAYETELFIEQGSKIRPGQLVLPSNRLDLKEIEAEIVRKALQMHNNNKTKAAEYLCVSRQTLRTLLKRIH